MKYKIIPPFNLNFLTPIYDFSLEIVGLGKSFKRTAISLSGLKKNDRLLDVGCATGTLLLEAKKLHPAIEAVGVDPDPKALSIARKKLRRSNINANLVRTRAEKMPFKDNYFDVVISTLAFHHIPHKAKHEAMREIYRILTPGGAFLLADIGRPKNIIWKLILKAEVRLIEKWEYVDDNLKGNIPIFMRRAGFKVSQVAKPYRGISFYLGRKSDYNKNAL